MYFCISFRTLFPKRKSTGKNAFTLLPVPDERDFFQRIFPFITSFDFFRRIFYDIFSSFPKPLSASASLTAPYLSENKQRPC
mgnify:FL=1